MKKGFFISAVVISAVVGALVSFAVLKVTEDKGSDKVAVIEKVDNAEQDERLHGGEYFTEYEPEKYPGLTYAAENSVIAVVNVEAIQIVQSVRRDPFLELLGFPQGYSQRGGVPREVKSGGSGVIVTSDGYIATNNHVISGASKYKVTLYDGRVFDAELVGTDPLSDLAVLKVDGKDLPALPFGSSDDLRLGEWVLAIGSPFDLESTITAGIVSAKARNLRANNNHYSIESFIQTDAAVNPGNSGGALVNARGELVGINTLIKSQTGTFMGYSFAIPSSIVKKVVLDLMEYGVVQRAVLGISYVPVNDEFISLYGNEYKVKEQGGVFVSGVDPNGAAYAAGVRVGDVITAIDGVELNNKNNLSEIMAKYSPNDKINISIKRQGEVKHFDLALRNKVGKEELLK